MVFFIPPQQRRLALLAAQADTAPALIYGASGTGKGAIAKWIHTSGPRAACVFREATRDTSLIDNIPLAQGGTLVIHEIGEWPLSEQLNLLTFLKTKSLPISNGIRMLVNVRIIATTSQSLEGRAQTGLFNSELLQKLNVFRIEMPPLSKRVDEFEDIVLGIVAEITRDLHKAHLRDLTPKAWSRVRSYEWPGNLRELRNVLRLTVAAAQGDLIEVTDLPDLGNDRIDFRTTREQFEKTYILELLRTFNWEVDTTCKMAKMNRETLVQKISQYGITQHP
ncbi:MAG: hypothetical protein A2070_03990 [Bdellovibrionales bacterium GWC1_52_8]|nr:MAG: hypothetical protein A2X97_13050 [Bdellovibrionales bacterium GWA1_52_35]OFZ44046.1 MAG: hypothetical protein A2070_03990 [Bdellovibrionales bacterium GWC1_52_8]